MEAQRVKREEDRIKRLEDAEVSYFHRQNLWEPSISSWITSIRAIRFYKSEKILITVILTLLFSN